MWRSEVLSMESKTWKRITGISFFIMLVCFLASFYVLKSYGIPDPRALSHQKMKIPIPRMQTLKEGQLVPFDTNLTVTLGGLPMQLSINGQAHDGTLAADIMNTFTTALSDIINEDISTSRNGL